MGFTTFASFFAFRVGYRVSSTEVGLVEKDEAKEEEEGGGAFTPRLSRRN